VQIRIGDILRIQNIAAPNRGSSLSANRVAALLFEDIEQLFPHSEVAVAVDTNRAVVQALEKQIIKPKKTMLPYADIHPESHHLLSAPGIGKVLALTILLETGDIRRFAGPGHYASYCRCVGSNLSLISQGPAHFSESCQSVISPDRSYDLNDAVFWRDIEFITDTTPISALV